MKTCGDHSKDTCFLECVLTVITMRTITLSMCPHAAKDYILTLFARVHTFKTMRRILENLVSDDQNHVSSCLKTMCPHAKNLEDTSINHVEKSMWTNHEGCIVYPHAKTIGQAVSQKHVSSRFFST